MCTDLNNHHLVLYVDVHFIIIIHIHIHIHILIDVYPHLVVYLHQHHHIVCGELLWFQVPRTNQRLHHAQNHPHCV